MSENKRKPYVREVNSDWWTKKPSYKRYMLRESTGFVMIWFIIEVFILLSAGDANAVVNILRSPIVIILNILTLIASLYHTYTWFSLTPKAINLVVNNSKIRQGKVTCLCLVVTLFITIILVLIFRLFFN